MKLFRKIACLATVPAIAMISVAALAQTAATTATPDSAGLFPSADVTAESDAALPDGVETHPPLRITPDKSEFVRLEKPVSKLLVANPTNASVLIDNPYMLVVVPKLPGATYFTALDSSGKVVMQRHIIVSSPSQKYVKIRQSCAAAAVSASPGGECHETRVYYCPDTCHELNILSENEAKAASRSVQKTVGRETGSFTSASAPPDEGKETAEQPLPTRSQIEDYIRLLEERSEELPE